MASMVSTTSRRTEREESFRNVGNTVDRRTETVFTKGMETYEITTEADTRSKSRQRRTWTVEAENYEDAAYEARMRHIALVGWNASVWVASC